MPRYTGDPLADFNARDNEQYEWLIKRPICADCGEHIQDETCYEFNGEYICESCLNDLHRKPTEFCQ